MHVVGGGEGRARRWGISVQCVGREPRHAFVASLMSLPRTAMSGSSCVVRGGGGLSQVIIHPPYSPYIGGINK